ncbi:hypothetical protein LXL04_005387 [Taraxacum kok-saghyz]
MSDKLKAAALTAATKGLSRVQAERATANATRNVNAYGQKEEGPSRWQEKKEAKTQMYLKSTEKQATLNQKKCQKCKQNGHWTSECQKPEKKTDLDIKALFSQSSDVTEVKKDKKKKKKEKEKGSKGRKKKRKESQLGLTKFPRIRNMKLDLHGSQGQVSKEILFEEHVSLVSSIRKKMANTSDFSRICKVSENLYKENEDKYFPLMVSIGPFHHGKEKLKAMEDYKWNYLNSLASRATHVEAQLGKCVEVLKALEDKARKCYGEEIHMDSDAFVEMMLVDGCFIIELLYKSCCKGTRRRGDPFLATYEVFFQLRHDLILLENQIPFFILNHLFNIVPTPKQCDNYSLIELAFRFFKKIVREDPYDIQERYGQEIHHLLDLLHQSFIPKPHILQLQSKQPHLQTTIPTLIQLRKIVTEINGYNSRNILEIEFNDGVFRIPKLVHHDLMETVLRNLIAMENCCYDATKYVTSYAFLMKSLIQSIDDAKVLHKKGIIDKEQEFITMFSKISVEVDSKDFYYGDLCEEVNKFLKVNKNLWYVRKARNCVTRCLRQL